MTTAPDLSTAAALTGVPGAVRPASRAAELGAFLRSRRERLRPEDVGLAAGLRRRTPGLRREEVAQLSGVGVTWYTWLEQGRRINASAQVLDALARTLRLDPAEREHLHRLAGTAASGAAPAPGADGSVPDEVRAVLAAIALPAAVLSSCFEVLAWNAPYGRLFPGVVGRPAGERNSLLAATLTPDCCNPFVDRDRSLPSMVAMLRTAYARHVGEARWDGFVRRLLAGSPAFARLWAERDVHGTATYPKVFRHPVLGELTLTVTTFDVLGAPEARLNVLTPAAGEQAAVLRLLQPGSEVVEEAVGACGCAHGEQDRPGMDEHL